ncbi:nucleoplasmin-like protein ANO39 isoform X2 [Cimex lectularius]|uniref:Nucleoplasmin core domain-containing protein n=1 Tax=Cimex lectularius TaxID=79782 RepID=A0A8I6SPW7_CIMLE|nr:nucleoplasmin-like protein ANO39 isoform X2 [Cimex lectularius]
MTEDYFWGVTLKKNKDKEVWDPDMKAVDGNESQGIRGEHTLLVKQIVLGADAKDGEVNVVEVEAMGYKSDVRFPIAVMKGGGPQSQAVLDLLFPDPPVTFHLVKGSGPVHLLGNHTVGSELVGDDDEEEDLEDELDEEDLDDLEESPERNNIEDKKRKIAQANSTKNKGKKAKLDEK